MPDVRLHEYLATVRQLIGDGCYDQALVHCRHILSIYPKHIAARCLLGEALLETHRPAEAAGCFEQTIAADPENLIARVGLSLLRRNEDALSEAIAHMERAFELAPGNTEVRRELQYLYSQRGAPGAARLKLTSGALGRLYARNNLNERAISEFRAALRDHPGLPDVRVALVEALWREDRRLEAAELCGELLAELPDCLKANLILADIWLRGGNEAGAAERLAVARALDPESRLAGEMMGANSPLPGEEITIPGLETPPAVGPLPVGEPQGVDESYPVIEPVPVQQASARVEEIPDRLSEPEPAAPLPRLAGFPDEDVMPDWLRDLEPSIAGEATSGQVLEVSPQQARTAAEPAAEPSGPGNLPTPPEPRPGEPELHLAPQPKGDIMERTLIIIKPDGVQRGLIGPILTRLERRGLRFAALKLIHITPELAARHYAVHQGKPFYEGLIQFITSGPVVVAVIEGTDAINTVRKTLGSTNPAQAEPGTVRADFGVEIGRNLVHGSDGPDTAAYEIPLFFADDEILSYERAIDGWIRE